MTHEKQQFTKEEVIAMLNELLEQPDVLMDAITNELTDYDAEELFNTAVLVFDQPERDHTGKAIT